MRYLNPKDKTSFSLFKTSIKESFKAIAINDDT